MKTETSQAKLRSHDNGRENLLKNFCGDPLVSFLMPVYNSEKTVIRAIESMLCQTYENIVIVIVIEHGCTDGTAAICEKYAKTDRRIRVYHNDSNLGVAESLNRGLCFCEGKYIARMDADDVSRSDRIEKQVRYMEENPDVDILGSQMTEIRDGSRSIAVYKWPGGEHIKAQLLFCNCIVHPSVMLRAEKFIQNGWRYPAVQVEDYALWAKLISKASMRIYPEPLLDYYVHDSSICVAHFDEVRKSSAEISRNAIESELGLDVSKFPDALFGWQGTDPVPYDLCYFLSQSAQLLRMIEDANERQGRFDRSALCDILTQQWQISKHIARVHMLSDDYTDYSEGKFKDTEDRYRALNDSKAQAVIYGVGQHTEYVLSSLGSAFPFEVTAFVDTDKSKHEEPYRGKSVLPPESLQDLSFDYVLVGSPLYFDEICKFLTDKLHIPQAKILDINVASDIIYHAQRGAYQEFFIRVEDKPKACLFCAPDYGNLGDHAIAEAAHRFFTERTEYEIIVFPLHQHNDFSALARHFIKPDDLILITGGGFLGSLWLSGEITARKVVEEYPRNQIVILPQTVFWEESPNALRELKLTQRAYARHKRLTLCARDKKTYTDMCMLYPENSILLVPDMVLYDNWSDYYSSEGDRNGVLLCLKTDKESILTEERRENLANVARKIEGKGEVICCDTDLQKLVSRQEGRELLRDMLQTFRNAKLVITDRLHGYIFAAVTGTPCVALGGYSHKNRETFEWVRHLPYMRFAEDVGQVEYLAHEALDVSGGVYDRIPLMPYFDELWETVNQVMEKLS